MLSEEELFSPVSVSNLSAVRLDSVQSRAYPSEDRFFLLSSGSKSLRET